MREIKFRGKHVDNGEWVYGSLEITHNKITFIWVPDAPLGFVHKVIPETVGQYTGLHDKDGKEIYEGDTVRAWGGESWYGTYEREDRCVVKWQSPGFDLVSIKNDSGNGWGFVDAFENIEIIGNIYSNPELLKGGTPND